jgi:hypothetical protein
MFQAELGQLVSIGAFSRLKPIFLPYQLSSDLSVAER